MAIKEFSNADMLANHMYVDPKVLTDGYLTVRSYMTSSYTKRDGSDGDAWLPWIHVFVPKGVVAPVKLHGRYVMAESPAEAYGIPFQPSWKADAALDSDVLHVFQKAFKLEDGVADVVTKMHDMTGAGDRHIIPGSFGYTGIDYRDVTLHGSLEDLETMLAIATVGMRKIGYDLVFDDITANSTKKGEFAASQKDIGEFARKAAALLKIGR